MKYLKYLLILLMLVPFSVKADTEVNNSFPTLYSKNAILYNMTTNEVLYELNPDEKVPIASLTKIMTTIVAIENINDIKKTVVIPEEGLVGLVEANASVAGFKLNDKVTYEDLLYGALLPSGADATQTLAYYLAGNIDNFVNLMNNKAQELGLTNTHFSDPTGLDDINNYSTVRDISVLLQYALNNDTFKTMFTAQEYTTTNGLKFSSTLKQFTSKYNLNNLYIYGSKTGFTDLAGYCLASIAKNNDTEYLLVTTGAPTETRYPYHIMDAINIYSYYTDNYYYITLNSEDGTIFELDTKYSNEESYKVKVDSIVQEYVISTINKDDFEYEYDGLEIVTPFTKKGEIGTLNIKLDGELVDTISVIYDGSLTLSIISLLSENISYVIMAVIIILLLISIIIYTKVRKKKKKKVANKKK